MKPIIVQKFGGTSVGSIERIQHVAKKVLATHQSEYSVVVVVSAMSGETNRLIELANQMQHRPSKRELDVLLSTGEQVTIALLSMAIEQAGGKAVSLTGAQVTIRTDDSHGKARIQSIDSERINNELSQGNIVIVAGFQGVDNDNNITTLGRGGSDTSAVAIAAALEAKECQIYTDVDGVYTTDPRVCEGARKLNTITFEEMLEMASQGSKVLQLRSVEFAGKYKVSLRVLSSFEEGEGTLIVVNENERAAVESPLVSGIAFNRDESKVSLVGIPDQPGVAYTILNKIAEANVEVDVIVQNIGYDNTNDLSFTVHRNELDTTLKALNDLQESVLKNATILYDEKIAKVSLVGVGMRSHSGVAATMFKALSEESINIQMITTSEIKITVIIEERYLELAVRAIHGAFKMDVEISEE